MIYKTLYKQSVLMKVKKIKNKITKIIFYRKKIIYQLGIWKI